MLPVHPSVFWRGICWPVGSLSFSFSRSPFSLSLTARGTILIILGLTKVDWFQRVSPCLQPCFICSGFAIGWMCRSGAGLWFMCDWCHLLGVRHCFGHRLRLHLSDGLRLWLRRYDRFSAWWLVCRRSLPCKDAYTLAEWWRGRWWFGARLVRPVSHFWY